MKRYVSLAGALLIGTVLAHEKKSTYKSAAVAKKHHAAEVAVQHHAAVAKHQEKKKPVYTDTDSYVEGVSSNTSKTGEKDSVTSRRTVRKAATSVTTLDGELTSNRTVITSVTSKDGELTSNRTYTSKSVRK